MIAKIKSQLKSNPKGMKISDLSQILKINRNNMAKYLEILLVSGEVEMTMYGNAKVYSLSKRVPLHNILNTLSNKIILLDKDDHIVWVNNALRSKLSIDLDKLVGKTLASSGDQLLSQVPHHISFRTEEHISEICVTIGGELRYYRIKQTPTILNDGEAGVIIQCENISKEKNFERIIGQSEARFKAILEDLSEFIVKFLPDGTLIFVNRAFALLMGKQAEDLLGTHFNPEIMTEDDDSFYSSISKLSPDHSVSSLGCRILSEEGVQYQQWNIRAFFNNTGKIIEYQGIGRDITGQVKDEERLRCQVSDMQFISRKTQEFLELSHDGNIYAAIGNGLFELLPDALISISSFDQNSSSLTVCHFCGKRGNEVFKEITGRDIIGSKFTIRDKNVLDSMRGKRLYKRNNGLFVGLFGEIPYTQCKQIENSLNIEDLYSLGLVSNGQILGNIAIFPKKGDTISDIDLIEAYIHQSSLFLSWYLAEEKACNHAYGIEFLSRKIKELLEIPDEDNFYSMIAEALFELNPQGYISVSSFDNNTSTATIRHVCGNGARKSFLEITGFDVIGFSFTINDPMAIKKLTDNQLFKAYGDLYTAFFGRVPYPVCKQIEDKLRIDGIYVLALTTGKELLGNIAIILQNGDKISNPRLIETFILQASLVLALKKEEVMSSGNK